MGQIASYRPPLCCEPRQAVGALCAWLVGNFSIPFFSGSANFTVTTCKNHGVVMCFPCLEEVACSNAGSLLATPSKELKSSPVAKHRSCKRLKGRTSKTCTDRIEESFGTMMAKQHASAGVSFTTDLSNIGTGGLSEESSM